MKPLQSFLFYRGLYIKTATQQRFESHISTHTIYMCIILYNIITSVIPCRVLINTYYYDIFYLPQTPVFCGSL